MTVEHTKEANRPMHSRSLSASSFAAFVVRHERTLVALNVSLLWPFCANARNGVCLNK